MHRISGQRAYCWNRAAAYRQLAADDSYTPATRNDYREMAERWMALAKSYAIAEEISGFMQWQAQRIEPPPDHGSNEILRLPLS